MGLITASIGDFLGALGNPEYFYLWLEPVLTWGLLFGLITFTFGLIIDEKKTQLYGLTIIIASSLCISPYLYQRSVAESRIIKVYEMDEPQRLSGYLGTRTERKSKAWIYYLTALSATLTVLVGGEKNRLGITLHIITPIFCVLAIIVGNSMHYDESRIYHPHLRSHTSNSAFSAGTG